MLDKLLDTLMWALNTFGFIIFAVVFFGAVFGADLLWDYIHRNDEYNAPFPGDV
jgi:hypothetical protein